MILITPIAFVSGLNLYLTELLEGYSFYDKFELHSSRLIKKKILDRFK